MKKKKSKNNKKQACEKELKKIEWKKIMRIIISILTKCIGILWEQM
jgi:hypothetical protein